MKETCKNKPVSETAEIREISRYSDEKCEIKLE